MTEAEARALLTAAGVEGAAGDVSRLRAAATDDAEFAALVHRRAAREPVSHLLGRRAFWNHEFLVTPAVLDPRPDTETLVEAALAEPFATVLDLGTGSGCILLSLLDERPDATGVGTDLSEAALEVARRNAARLDAGRRATWLRSDWLVDVTGHFDLVVSNPPYIAEAEMADLSPEVLHEPRLALTPGGDGLDAYRILTRDAPEHLAPGGRLIVEIGAGQGPAVAALFAAAGLARIVVLEDLNGRKRVVSGKKT